MFFKPNVHIISNFISLGQKNKSHWAQQCVTQNTFKNSTGLQSLQNQF